VSTARVIGPAVAGALIGIKTIGTAGVFLITSVLMAIAVVWSSRLPHIPPARRETRSPYGQFVDGWRYMRTQPQVGLLLVVSTIIVSLGFSFMLFMPAIARMIFHTGSSGFGTMSALNALGAVAATFLIADRGSNA